MAEIAVFANTKVTLADQARFDFASGWRYTPSKDREGLEVETISHDLSPADDGGGSRPNRAVVIRKVPPDRVHYTDETRIFG